MTQHTGNSLCYNIQTLSTAGPVRPHCLLLVGLPLVLPREGAHPAPPGHSYFLCLGQVCCWHLWPFQERVEPWQGALSMQDQEHEATQYLWCCQICKGLREGQHHHEELWGPPEPDVLHQRFSLRGVRWCQTTESQHRQTQTWKPDTNPWWGHEETGVYGTCPTVQCQHWWVPHTLLLWNHHPTQDVHHGGATSCQYCHHYDHLS